MHVLHVIPGMAVTSGGPRNLIGLVAGLARQGVDTTLMTTTLGAASAEDMRLHESGLGKAAACVVHNVWTLGGRYGLAPSMVQSLRRSIATFDLVHIHWLYNFACIAAARAAMSAGVPFVIQQHHAALESRGRRVRHAGRGAARLVRAAPAGVDVADRAGARAVRPFAGPRHF